MRSNSDTPIVRLHPSGHHRPGPACHRAVGRRVRGSEIRLAVWTSGGGWGDSVIIRVLADLVAAGQLVNKYDGKGYGLPAQKGDPEPTEAAGQKPERASSAA